MCPMTVLLIDVPFTVMNVLDKFAFDECACLMCPMTVLLMDVHTVMNLLSMNVLEEVLRHKCLTILLAVC